MDYAYQHLTLAVRARVEIDTMLRAAGWIIQNRSGISVAGSRGVANCEFLLDEETPEPRSFSWTMFCSRPAPAKSSAETL